MLKGVAYIYKVTHVGSYKLLHILENNVLTFL